MQAKDVFLRIRDYIEGENILDELERFLGDDELAEFCDYLKEEFDIEMSGDIEEFYNNDDY